MGAFVFSFDEGNFGKIFPFFILLDKELKIQSFGNSISKIYPVVTTGKLFTDYFNIKRPYIDEPTLTKLKNSANQLLIIECKSPECNCTDSGCDVTLRGQFSVMNDNIVFIGSPWFVSLEEIKKNNLNLFDFASHDPLLDLLQLLRNQEVTTTELQELLKINNEQKNELKRDKEELNKLSLVASANENAIVFTHPDAEIFWCNDAYTELTGFEVDEVIGRTPVEIGITDKTNREALKQMIESFYSGKSFDVEIPHGRKDGSYFWSRTKGQPIYDDNGKVVQYFAMIEDMTEAKKQEERLQLLSLIAQKNINAVVICNEEGRIEWVNNSFLEMSGYTEEEVKGQKPGEMLQGEETNPETIKYLNRQIHQGKPFNCEIVNYSKSGKKYWAKIQGQAIHDKYGNINCYFAIEEDITKEKNLERQKEELLKSLEKSNKELEDYAQIVSHDLKSPLRSISSLIAWIKEDNEEELNEQTKSYLQMIDDKLEKMDHLIQGVLTYSKIDKTDIAKEKVNVHDVVSNIINIIHIPPHISVKIKGKLPVIKADRFRMHQLFQNLIGNAVTYIDKPEGNVEIAVKELKQHYVFSVKDNGPGIAEADKEKIFKVFHSLVKSEKSSGLGLSIVNKIVDNYKGKIWIESEVGVGSVFFVKIPKT
ncbi:hypothetical protein GCM10007424_19360 [Flavobacterium suaedae]|uniref:Guanylate cyclase n=1 Tax=Flavobacterium suaedae TaxID=1767027 RepID=A0ABQ1JVR9_9FLAO|nr:PAS domain-containing protein [Flavobacterium suaedae]GGB79326.1 hypothetical protein GCM10007424_19360 [Flavobacterium suaedae]